MSFEIPGHELHELVGTGGMSTVWRATETATDRIVAVKILNREFSDSTEDVRAFWEEERMMERIRHPNVVEAYQIGNHDGLWYLTMEFVDGYTFDALLKRKHHLSESDCILIGESVASALDFAWNEHAVVHCDIKPDNLMINSAGMVKMTDLGISQRFNLHEESGAAAAGDHVIGTPAYISPEQIYGDVQLDCRADIYSLGATLYHLATGRVLFPGADNEAVLRAHCAEAEQAPDPRSLQPELSEGFAQMLEAMTVKSRDGRLRTWQEVFYMCSEVEKGNAFMPRRTRGASSIALGQGI